jgi:hypothetical protein
MWRMSILTSAAETKFGENLAEASKEISSPAALLSPMEK